MNNQSEPIKDKYEGVWLSGSQSSIDNYYKIQVCRLVIKKMREALEFYQNIETYKHKAHKQPSGAIGFITDIELDRGDKAREAMTYLDKRIME